MKKQGFGTTTQRRRAAFNFIDDAYYKGRFITTRLVREYLVKKFGMAIDNNEIALLLHGGFLTNASNEVRRPRECRENCPSNCDGR